MNKHLQQQLPNTRVSKPSSDISYGLNLRAHKPKNNNINMNKDKDDQAKLKLMDDLKMLPEDQGFEDYKDVTIEGFARAQLARYGWKEGMGIGRNAASKEDVKVRVYEKRVGREGLGCNRDDVIVRKRISNHSNFKGLEKNKKNKRSRVECRDLEEDLRRMVKKQEVAWVASHIRVRVISGDFKDGRFYRKKGEVLDVVGAPTTCDLYMDDTKEIVQGVCQDFLQTVIPRPGGPVLVLFGKHKGAYGSVVEIDLDREIALVKDADTHEMLSVKLDQIAEYTGDPSSLGY